jgi:hypothetical protein
VTGGKLRDVSMKDALSEDTRIIYSNVGASYLLLQFRIGDKWDTVGVGVLYRRQLICIDRASGSDG